MFTKIIGTISRLHMSKIFQNLSLLTKEIPVVKIMDYTLCPDNCDLKNKYKYDICMNGCNNCKLKVIENDTLTVPHIVQKETIISNNKPFRKLSKSQILQYIAYHFLPLDKNGKFKYLLEKNIAEFINFSLKTVKRNNEVLKEVGLINYNYEDTGIISIEIVNYTESFKVRKQKGKGGIKIPLNIFENILKLKNIDEIKFTLFMFERYISVSSQFEDFDYHKLISKKFGFLISKGKRYSKKIHEIISNLKTFFDLKENEDKFIEFKLNDSFKAEVYNKEFTQKIEKEIFDKLDEKKIITTAKDIDDLIDLAKQYGKDKVLVALNTYRTPKFKINLGGFVRNTITQSYFDSIGVILK